MKKLFYVVPVFLVWSILFLCCIDQVQAAKTKKEKGAASSQALKILSNDGESVIYGSVLNPKADEVNILLSKQLLTKIRKAGLENLSVNLVSALNSTKTYSVSQDAIILQKKRVGKKAGRYLVISIFNLTSTSGITISPSALPADNYRLRITGSDLNLTTDTFNYQTPALIVGTVDSMTTGLVSIEDLEGDELSDRTVATNPNGTFFTEVRASKITESTKARKYLKAQVSDSDTTGGTTEEPATEEINTGVIHAVTDTDLYAITPLSNDANDNASITNDPVVVDDSSTLTANLVIASAEQGNEELAFEVAKAELEDIQSEGEEEDNAPVGSEGFGVGCDIEQFASQCSGDKEALASLGEAFKAWIVTANCFFPEFKLLQKILPKLPDFANAEIGAGYCEHAEREIDDEKPCEIYAGILREFKEGHIHQLVCPPRHCDEFRNIRPPRCFEPEGVCEEMEPMHEPGPMFAIKGPSRPFTGPQENFVEPPRNCIHRPMKDLFCAKVPDVIPAEDCSDEGFGPRGFGPGWVIEADSQGNKYCVPSYFPPQPPMPPGFMGPKPPSNSKEAVNECPVKACHDECAKKYGHGGMPPVPPGPMPMPMPMPPATSIAGTSDGIRGGEVSGVRGGVRAQFAPGPMQPYMPPVCEECDCHFACDADAGRVADCGNPSSKYFSNKCCNRPFDFGPGMPPVLYTHVKEQFFGGGPSPGFSVPPPGFGYPPPGRPGKGPIPLTNNLIADCLCRDIQNNFNEKGFVKEDVQKICRDKCPEGYEKASGFHDCLPICSEGLVRDPGGICRKNCPPGQNENEFGICSCPPGLIPDPKDPKQCISSGPCPQYCYNYPVFRKLLASHDLGSFGGGYTSPTTGPGYIPPTTGPGYVPPGSSSLPPECQRCTRSGPPSCPQGYKLDPTGQKCVPAPVTTCSGNMYPNPNPLSGSAECICPSGLPYWDDNARQCVATCPGGNPPATTSANMPPGSPIPCGNVSQCSPPTPIKCPDGRCVIANSDCTTQNYCSPGIAIGTNGCTCNWSGGTSNATGYCTCPANSSPYTKETGCTSTSQCPPATPIKCSDGRCVILSSDCTLQSYCVAGVQPGTNGCSCAPPATPTGPNGICQCPAGSSIAYSQQGCGSSSTQCPAPFVTNPSGTPPCRCPNATPYIYGQTCVVTCPASLVPTTEANGQMVCKCSNGSYPDAQGGCGRTCAPQEVPTQTNPCTCASGATFNAQNICSCPAGQSYTQTGCIVSNYCSPGITVGTASCTCNPTGGAYTLNGLCTCPTNSGPYTKETGCTASTAACTSPQVINPTTNACACPPGMYRDPNNTNNCLACAACTVTGQVPTPNVYDTCSCSCPQGQVLNGPQCCAPCTGTKVFSGATCACACPTGQTEDASGNCVASQTVPNAPSNLQTTSVTATQVALSWGDSSTNEDGFKIFRKLASDPSTSWAQVTSVGPNIVSYTDTSIVSGTSYNYHVNAYNSVGTSPDSNTITVAVP